MMRSPHWWRTRFFVFACLSAIFALITVGVGAFVSNSGSAAPSEEDASEAQAALFVDPSTVPVDFCVKLMQKYDYQLVEITSGSHKGEVTPRFVFGASEESPPKFDQDGVNVPLDPIRRKAAMATICHDPAQAAMVMNRLGLVEVAGRTIAEVNSAWIQAQGPAEADGEIPAVKAWSDTCKTKVIETHIQCARTMAYAAYLVGKFHPEGVERATSTWNVFTPDVVVGSIPAYYLNPVQEKKGYWLAFSYKSKTGGICLRFGFNVGTASSGVNGGDQRIAGLPCEKPVTTAPATTAPATTAPATTAPATAPPTTAPPTTAPPTTAPPTTAPPTTQPPTTAPPTTAPPTGKHASDAPSPDRSIRPAPSGGYVDRTGQSHDEAYTPPASTVSPEDAGRGESDDGAVNDTQQPATSSPAAEVPVTTAPTTAPAMP